MEITKKQLDNFWENVSEANLRYLLEYAKDKVVIDKAKKLLDNFITNEDIVKYLKNK